MTGDQSAALRLIRDYPAEYGRRLGYKDLRDDLHGEWIRRMVLGEGDMTLLAHRGSYKTTVVTIAMTLLIIVRGDLNTIFIRKTDADVKEVLRQVQRNLSHPVTQAIYRAITGRELQLLKTTDSEITTSAYTAARGASQLQGIGTGGSITGKHADMLFTDDIVNLTDRRSRAERDRTKGVYQELQNIRNPGGRIINTGTPWHKDDAFMLMPRAERFDCYSTGLLKPEQLERLRRSMSPSLFAANYELRHIADENALFTEAPTFTRREELLYDGIAHVDAAYGGEDYTAFTAGRRVGDKLYLYGRMWPSHVDTLLGAIAAETERLRCLPVLCETNGDKGYLAKELQRNGVKSRSYTERENKYIKISTFLRKWWPNIVWLEGTDMDYLAQIMDYTEDAEHDDAPDSAACVARWWDKRSGVAYTSPFEV